ncbi:MAG: ABC transporter substrate-binding protein [Chloroflexota bacterium]
MLTAKNSKIASQVALGTPFPDKFLTASAAGTPPDLVFIPPEGGWPQNWANKQIVKNLDSYFQRDKLSVNDFFAPAWQGSLFQGHQYVMPIEVDPNFPLVYNKALLQEVGIAQPPSTVTELDDANQKLYKKTGNNVSRLGIFPPWMTYGSGNALLTYFGVFGGGYFPPGATDQTKLDMTQPGNVSALSWMKKYADQFGGYDAILAFSKGWGKDGYVDGVGHAFLAMGPMVSANYTSAVKAAQGSPYATSFAAAVMPVADGVKPDPGWLGGWAMGIPSGAKRSDDSWTALSWLGGSAEGTDAWAEVNGFLPGFKQSPYFAKNAADPVVSVYIKVLQNSYVVAPSPLGWQDIPAKAYDTLLLDTVQGKTDINTALQQFQQVAQAALDKAKSS